MQGVAPTALAGTVVAAVTAMIAAMDFGMLVFVYAVVLVAMACAITTYVMAMKQAKNEIVRAFEEHLRSLHEHHLRFVDQYDRPKDRRN